METKNIPTEGAAGAVPADTTLSPAAVMAQLRALKQQIPGLAPLTPQERKTLRAVARTPGNVIQASLSVIGASEIVQQAVPAESVQRSIEDAAGWTEVENELRAMTKAVADANLIRRQRAGLAASRAYLIGQQVVRDPGNSDLLPHLEEVKRQKSLTRRRKPQATTPATPPEVPAPK